MWALEKLEEFGEVVGMWAWIREGRNKDGDQAGGCQGTGLVQHRYPESLVNATRQCRAATRMSDPPHMCWVLLMSLTARGPSWVQAKTDSLPNGSFSSTARPPLFLRNFPAKLQEKSSEKSRNRAYIPPSQPQCGAPLYLCISSFSQP